MGVLNLNNLGLNRLNSDPKVPTKIFMMEGDDFTSRRRTDQHNIYEIDLYYAIEEAVSAGLINIPGLTPPDGSETKVESGNDNITIAGDGTIATPYIISSTGKSDTVTIDGDGDTTPFEIIPLGTANALVNNASSLAVLDAAISGGGGGFTTDNLTSGAFNANITRSGGSATTLSTPSAGEFVFDIKEFSNFQKASIFGNNTTLNGFGELTLRFDNSANAEDLRFIVQIYDATSNSLVDQQITATVHNITISSNITTIIIPGLNGFGSAGYYIEIR